MQFTKKGFLIGGGATVVAGLMLLGAAVGSTPSTVLAGVTPDTSTPTNTPTVTNTPTATSTLTSDQKTATATAADKQTATAEARKTATKEAQQTATALKATGTPPTSTTIPVATTAPPTTAPPVATATKIGGAGGAGVKPPNTGTGSSGTDYAPWFVTAGALLVLIGGGSVLVGVKRRS